METKTAHTGFESADPLPVSAVVVRLSSCLGPQPHGASLQPSTNIIFDEHSQAERLEAAENDRLSELALAKTVLRGSVVIQPGVVGLVAEPDVGEASAVQFAVGPGERSLTLAFCSTRTAPARPGRFHADAAMQTRAA